MHAEIEALRNEIQTNQSVVASTRALIQGLVSRISAALDNDDLQAARDMLVQLRDSDATLAAAVTANTPAAGISEPQSNANPSPGLPGPPADQSPNTANPNSPDAVPQATGVNATPAAAEEAANAPPGPPS